MDIVHVDPALTELAYKRVEQYKDLVSEDSFRLHYHLMPPVGLLNDPNGFVFFNGHYHVFYQWNPFETNHGAKFWGHYISEDLVHWKEAPIALAPDQWYDKNGCYSGSAVIKEGKMILFYTGNVKDTAGNRQSYQCMAVSEDGIHFDKKGPVIYLPEGYTAHFRDPKVFEKDGFWYMVIGAQTEEEKGEVVLYRSKNLEDWSFLGPLTGSGKNGLGYFGFMWECPDLFELNNQDILIVSPQGLEPEGIEYNNIYQSGYFSGEIDYDGATFVHGGFTELDRGFDFYAPQTTEDDRGRRLLFGWMGNAEEEGHIHPTVDYKWVHSLTLPRQLEWKDGKLFQKPVEELAGLRGDAVVYSNVEVSGQEVQLEKVEGTAIELQLSVKELEPTVLSITLGSQTQICFDKNKEILTFQRAGNMGNGELEFRHCKLKELSSLRIFRDTSSVEVFVNEGEEVFSSRVFEDPAEQAVTFKADNGKVVMDIEKWNLKKVSV